MDATLAEGTLGYILWGLIAFGGLLLYLGVGAVVTGILGGLDKKTAKDQNKPWKGIRRGPAWVITLGWPLIIAAAALFLAWAIGAIGAIVVIVLAVVAGIIAVILAVIALILAIVAAIIGIILAAIIAIVVFAAALAVVVLLIFLVLSPLFGISSLKSIVTKFHPTGGQIQNDDEESNDGRQADGESSGG